jgi:hypothetical protein
LRPRKLLTLTLLASLALPFNLAVALRPRKHVS